MRKMIFVFMVMLLSSILSSTPTRADGIILPNALSPDYLAVTYHHVTVDIKDNHAVTRVEQEFFNPYDFQVEGRYTFPVPPEAILSNFRATVDGQAQVVIRQDAATTNASLYDVVSQRHDPSLLQYADWETLAFDLTLQAGASRQMVLEYEEVLKPSGGMYHYHYVLGTERYTAAPLESVSITLNLDSSAGLGTLYSSSHDVSTERLATGRAQVSWQAEYVQPTENFDLFFAPTEGGFGGGLLSGHRQDNDHFLFLFEPELESLPEVSLPKDIVFVVDRSGSMSGEKIEQARNALHFILGQLNAEDRFSIVGFDDRLSLLSPLRRVDQDSLTEARRFVDNLFADGSTDIDAALQVGLTILQESETRAAASKQLIFLTDGLPTAGITDGRLIANLVAQRNETVDARLHGFGVGYDVNTHLLDLLAEDNAGTVTYVQPGENLERVLTEFYSQIANPLLTDIEVTFEGLEVSDLYPQQLPDMFQGSSLLLSGRYQTTAGPITVHVQGRAGEQVQHYSYEFELDPSNNHDFVPRLWATRRVGRLLDQVRVEGESAALIEEIRTLGLGYGLVTPYTTFVIAAQVDGAASTANMALYDNDNRADLNRVSGETTVQARVQNQMYQETDRADLASGANIINHNQRSMAQISNQNVDLSLLQNRTNINEPITNLWIEQNIKVDRQIPFGSDEYFDLAADPAVRPFLVGGTNVVFSYQGQIIAIRDADYPPNIEPEVTSLDIELQTEDMSLNNRSNRSDHAVVDREESSFYSWLSHMVSSLVGN